VSTVDLDQALRILAEVHTDQDDVTGFVVHMGATPEMRAPWHHKHYAEAWKAVRAHLGLPVDPPASATASQ